MDKAPSLFENQNGRKMDALLMTLFIAGVGYIVYSVVPTILSIAKIGILVFLITFAGLILFPWSYDDLKLSQDSSEQTHIEQATNETSESTNLVDLETWVNDVGVELAKIKVQDYPHKYLPSGTIEATYKGERYYTFEKAAYEYQLKKLQ